MGKIKRVIFVAGSGTLRAAMAAAIMKDMAADYGIDALARGFVVSFPEPMNQKAEAVLISNDLPVEGFVAQQIMAEDITDGTLIFAFDDNGRQKLIDTIDTATEDNTFVLSSYVGDEIEIVDPYGAPIQTYGLCFEVLKKSIEKLIAKINQ